MKKMIPTSKRLMERISEKIIERGAKWPPDCGGLIFQPERPRVDLEDALKEKKK